MFPERFNNKTNGVTPRRWLLLANPDLAKLLTEAVGDGWVTDLAQLRQVDPLAEDAAFRTKFLAAKRAAKARFVDWIKATAGIALDPDTLFDVQIKRIHEYKRQLLNAIQVVVWYNRLRANPTLDVPPRTFLFAGKAAPAYHLAKLIIKLINDIGRVVNADPAIRGKLRVEFLPNYSVTLAERLIPATDVSEQISTAGLRGQRHEQHEVHDERRPDRRHPRRGQHRDRRGGRRGERVHVRPDRRAGRRPRVVQPALALRERGRDAPGPGPDLLRPLQPPTSRASSSRSATRC